MKIKKVIIYFILVSIIITGLGCGKEQVKKQEKINLLIVKNTVKNREVLDFMLQEYSGVGKAINVIESEEEIISEELLNNNNIDLIFSDRANMLELSNNGLIRNLNSYYIENKFLDKFYSSNISYGRNKKDYYGIAINPYSLVLIINKEKGKAYYEGIGDNMIDVILKQDAIPTLLPSNMNAQDALSALVANNGTLSWELSENFNKSKEDYLEIYSGKVMFNNLNTLIKERKIFKEKFQSVDYDYIEKVANGEVPMLLTSSLISNKLDASKEIVVFDKMQLGQLNINATIGVAGILSATAKSEKNEEINDFLDYITNQDTLKKLSENGIITGNRVADDKLNGNRAVLQKTLVNCNENNIIYEENLPYKMKNKLREELNRIFEGYSDGEEWNRIVS